MNDSRSTTRRLVIAALCAALVAGTAFAGKGGPGDDPKKPRPKGVITAVESSFEQEKLKVVPGRDGLAAFEIQYEPGCAAPCGPARLQLRPDSVVTYQGKPYSLREVRRLDGRPGTIYVKAGTEQVTRVTVY